MVETRYDNICNILAHVVCVEKLERLSHGETLLIYYDRTKTPNYVVQDAMMDVRRVFPDNKVVFISSDCKVSKVSPGIKIPLGNPSLKTDSWWERFKKWINDPTEYPQ